MDLTTNFMGLELSNPVIAGASELTGKPEIVSKIEAAGAGAVVVKSLFEEQIQLEEYQWEEENARYDALHPMMETVGPHLSAPAAEQHLHTVKNIKEQASIPVIASLNAVTRSTWVTYAHQLQETGVDALEVNLYASPRDPGHAGEAVEDAQLSVLKDIRDKINIPVCAKLSPFYTNPLNFLSNVSDQGIDGMVLFNRLFQPDLDPDNEQNIFPFNLSTKQDNRLPLRFTGLLYNQVDADLCASTGVMDAEDVAKMILVGADCVQVVSTLYRNGIDHLTEIIEGLKKWLNARGYSTLDECRGRMSKENNTDPWFYTRAQYVNMLMKGNPLAR